MPYFVQMFIFISTDDLYIFVTAFIITVIVVINPDRFPNINPTGLTCSLLIRSVLSMGSESRFSKYIFLHVWYELAFYLCVLFPQRSPFIQCGYILEILKALIPHTIRLLIVIGNVMFKILIFYIVNRCWDESLWGIWIQPLYSGTNCCHFVDDIVKHTSCMKIVLFWFQFHRRFIDAYMSH